MSDDFVKTFKRFTAIVMHHSIINDNISSRENRLSLSQLLALNFIYHKGSLGVSDLAEKIGISNAASSQLLERMVQQGIVSRHENPEDRRNKLIKLTEKGKELIKDILTSRGKWLEELQHTMTPDEQQQVQQVLQLVIDKAVELFPSPHMENGQHSHSGTGCSEKSQS